MATGGVAGVVFVVVGVSVDVGRERREWGTSSLMVVWGGGHGVMVDVDVTVMFNIHHVMC